MPLLALQTVLRTSENSRYAKFVPKVRFVLVAGCSAEYSCVCEDWFFLGEAGSCIVRPPRRDTIALEARGVLRERGAPGAQISGSILTLGIGLVPDQIGKRSVWEEKIPGTTGNVVPCVESIIWFYAVRRMGRDASTNTGLPCRQFDPSPSRVHAGTS